MRILNVVHQYPPATGGAEKYTADLAEALVRKGHAVTVYTSRSSDYRHWDNTLPKQETRKGVNVRRFNSFYRGALTYRLLHYGLDRYFSTLRPRYEPLVFWGNGPVMPGLYRTLVREAKNFDVVHIVNLHYAQALTAFFALQRSGVPVVISPLVHIEQPLTHQVGYMLRMLRDADGIIALTDAERVYIKSLCPDQRVTVAGVGLEMSQFEPISQEQARAFFDLPCDAFVVLFLGRKTRYKRLDLVYEAFARLAEKYEHVYLLSVGPESEASLELAKRFSHLSHVVVRGRVSDQERLAALACADVLAMPSEGESFGIVYLEAWAYHVPVLGADVAAVSSLIDDGQNGMLCEAGNAQAVYEALHWMLTHPGETRAMGNAGYAKLTARYEVSHITDRVEGAFIRAIRHHKTKNAPEMEC